MVMSLKLAKLTMDLENGNGAKINKIDGIGQNGDGVKNMVVLNS